MDPVEQAIMSIVDANNGRIAYRTIHEQLTPEQARQMPKALKSLKSKGIAMNQNRRDENGNLVFEVFRMQSQGGSG